MQVRSVTLLISTFVLLCLVYRSSALGASPVLGIDLGSDVFKVMILQGGTPEIVLNEQSGRKTKALVGFAKDGERVFGAAAAQLKARYPQRVISSPQHFLGKAYPDSSIDESRYPFTVVDNNGTYGFEIDEATYSPEEILAMIFEEAARMAKAATGATRITDCTIVISPSLTQSERIGLINAAKIANLNVLLLAHEGTSTAVQYLRSRLLGEESVNQHTIFYDVGHSHASATLVRFHVEKMNNSTIHRKVMANLTSWEQVGGSDFDKRLTEFLLTKAEKDLGTELRNKARIVTRLEKEARKAKEVLSANKEVTVRIESLFNDEDFSAVITREEFETMCEDLFELALAPVMDLLKSTSVPLEEIDIEVVGGGSRVLKIGEKLTETFGDRVGRHLNGDESALIGASLYAATGKAGKRSSFVIKDTLNRAVGLTFDIEEVEPASLFSQSSRTQTYKNKNVIAEEAFTCHIYYEDESLLSSGIPVGIGSYEIADFPDFVALESKLSEEPAVVKVRFDIDSLGLITCSEAAIRYDEYVEEVVLPAATPTPAATVGSGEAEEEAVIEETEEEENVVDEETEENTEETEENTEEEQEEEEEVIETQIVKKTRTIPLTINILSEVQQLTPSEISKSRMLLSRLKREDGRRQLRAETKNELESYVYSTLDMLETEAIRQVSTEEERESFSASLYQIGDWLYDEGEDATLEVYQETLSDLKTIGDAMVLRSTERELRPLAAVAFHEWKEEALNSLKDIVKERRVEEEEKETLVGDIRSLETWLEEQQEAQSSLPITAEPAWLTSELIQRQSTLAASLKRLSRRRIRTPTPTPTPTPSIDMGEEGDAPADNEGGEFNFEGFETIDFDNINFGTQEEQEIPIEHDEL